eukprot:6375778-Pyramimonas_sp.AAC.1
MFDTVAAAWPIYKYMPLEFGPVLRRVQRPVGHQGSRRTRSGVIISWARQPPSGNTKQNMLMFGEAVGAVHDLLVHWTLPGILCNWTLPDAMVESVTLPTSKRAEF